MKYKTAAAFRTALERRLLDLSRESGSSLVRLRKAVVFDRLLARLVLDAPGRWVLKGALALDFRMGERTRTTKDMDLVRQDDEESATADLVACQSVDLDDFFVFAVQKAGRIIEEQDGGAVRYRVRAELAGRLFENDIVDIGFSDPLAWRPEVIPGTDLLSFAGFDRIEVPVLPLEQHVAEKVHAYTGRYSLGHSSSRVKDLIDLVLVKQTMQLDAKRLRAALIESSKDGNSRFYRRLFRHHRRSERFLTRNSQQRWESNPTLSLVTRRSGIFSTRFLEGETTVLGIPSKELGSSLGQPRCPRLSL